MVRSNEQAHTKAIIEGLIFVSGQEGITLFKLADMVQLHPQDVSRLVSELQAEYDQEARGIQIIRTNNHLLMTTRAEHVEWLASYLQDEKSATLSQAALETLAIIAYQQPVTRIAIEEIRGVQSDRPIQTLLQRGLIKELGRAQGVGRPILFGTTDTFLKEFGLHTLDDLAPLNDSDDPQIPLF